MIKVNIYGHHIDGLSALNFITFFDHLVSIKITGFVHIEPNT